MSEGAAGGDFRRLLFSFTVPLMALALGVFALDDLVAGRKSEGLATAVLTLFLATIAAIIPRLRRIEWPCRLSTALALALLLHTMAVGGGGGAVFVWFFVLPLCVLFLLGRVEGVYWVIGGGLAAAVLFFGGLEGFHRYDADTGLRFLICYAIFSVLSYGLESSRAFYFGRLEREKQAVAGALSQVETLRGLLPICASCKSVREDGGYWSRIERYLAEHSLAELVHALCPQCGGDSDLRASPSRADDPPLETASGGLFASLEKSFLDTDLPRAERRRRAQFSLILMVATPALAAYGLEDVLTGRWINGAFDLLLTAFMVRAFFLLKRSSDARTIYRVFAGLALVALFSELEAGGGLGFAFFWAFPFPGMAMLLLGHREGAAWSALTFLLSAMILLGPFGHTYELPTSLRLLITFVVVVLLSYGFESSRARSYRRLRAEKRALENALGRVATLRGMLPICPQCKKIRDDRGYWQEIEQYVGEQTGGSFSHGLCPDCLESFYDDLDDSGQACAAGTTAS